LHAFFLSIGTPNGLAGGYPVETLERQWGVEWRENQKERKSFNKRRSIITTIKPAANVAEERGSRLNKYLNYLAKHNDQIFE
jgi:hypothetical protein